MLAEFGCHQYQGYFFSRPVPAEQIPDLFDNTEQPERWNYQI
jgi:EAL domain-containing protein (putative c-di-GMP-specific phosphodiesterase class I)